MEKRRNRHRKFISGLVPANKASGIYLGGFGPAPDRPLEDLLAGHIEQGTLLDLANKLGRGFEFVHNHGRFVEPPYEVNMFLLENGSHRLIDLLLSTHGQFSAIAAGMNLAMARPPHDPLTALYCFQIWGKMNFYIWISREEWALQYRDPDGTLIDSLVM